MDSRLGTVSHRVGQYRIRITAYVHAIIGDGAKDCIGLHCCIVCGLRGGSGIKSDSELSIADNIARALNGSGPIDRDACGSRRRKDQNRHYQR